MNKKFYKQTVQSSSSEVTFFVGNPCIYSPTLLFIHFKFENHFNDNITQETHCPLDERYTKHNKTLYEQYKKKINTNCKKKRDLIHKVYNIQIKHLI